MKSNTLIQLCLLSFIMTGCKLCPSNAVKNTPVVVTHTMPYIINSTGRIEITVTCPDGEQMIGGGYRIPRFEVNTKNQRPENERSPQEIFDGTNGWNDKATECDKNQAPLIVEASYPSSLKTWTVIIYNPDANENCYHFGDMIQVYCYAVTNKNLPLRMKIRSTTTHPTNVSGAPPTLKDTVNCPQGSVVTAGGFKMVPHDTTNWKMFGHFHPPLWGSYPNIENLKAIGWTSEYTTNTSTSVDLTTYVLYSSTGRTLIPIGFRDNDAITLGAVIPSPLEDGPVKIAPAEKPDGFNIRNASVACDQGYFSSGGGFRIKYDPLQDRNAPANLIPHSVPLIAVASSFVNGIETPYSGWTAHFWAGYQADYYRWATVELDSVYTIQLKNLPKNIEVGITNPPDESFITEDPANKGYSIPIQFKGYGIDHDGSPIIGTNLKWEIVGASNGTDGWYKTAIKLDAGTYDSYIGAYRFLVKLTATGKNGDKETASIFLYYKDDTIVL